MDKPSRHSTDEQRAALKSATRRALKSVGGKSFSIVTRVGAPTLSEYGSIAQPKDFMPVDIVLDLQGEFPEGVPSPLLAELAAVCGFKLVPLDDEQCSGEPLDLHDVGSIMKEGGEAKAAALKAAMLPGCLESNRSAQKEIAEAIAVKTVGYRKLVSQERRMLRRGAA